MRIYYFILASFLTIAAGCAEKKYKWTRKFPNCNLYVEVFTANSWGLNQEYLTDSSTFRMYVGTVDEEHDYYIFQCQQDSIYIKKVKPSEKNCRWVTTEDGLKTVLCDTLYERRKPISLAQLRAEKNLE